MKWVKALEIGSECGCTCYAKALQRWLPLVHPAK
jgi:hypothetical protein